MIDVSPLRSSSYATLKKEFIPPQLMPYYGRIIDSNLRHCYALFDYTSSAEPLEQINFCITSTSFGKFMFAMPFVGYGSMFDIANVKILKEMIVELEGIAKEDECLSMSLCTHPLSNVPREMHKEIWPGFDYEYKNFCQISDLSKGHPIAQLDHRERMVFGAETSKMEKAGFEIVKSPSLQDFNQWYAVYTKRFEEFKAQPISKTMCSRYLMEARKGNVDFWMAKRNDVGVIGGIIFAKGKGIIDYNISAFDSKYRELYATTAILNAYLLDCSIHGVRYFNWQSSPGRSSGTYKYKARWGGQEYVHYYLSKALAPIETITAIPLEKLKRELPFCYVLPYSLWGEPVKE